MATEMGKATQKSNVVIYVHGQGGNAEESKHYQPLFQNSDVVGVDYTSQTPWEAEEEFPRLFDEISRKYGSVTVIANSIGAYYSMIALSEKKIDNAVLISPITDMQKLIEDRMALLNVTEDELRKKGTVETPFGQSLSWKYLIYARKKPAKWSVPTHILYGEKDEMTSFETISRFADQIHASLTVMENGEHWFHTEEQMTFLDRWIKSLNL